MIVITIYMLLVAALMFITLANLVNAILHPYVLILGTVLFPYLPFRTLFGQCALRAHTCIFICFLRGAVLTPQSYLIWLCLHIFLQLIVWSVALRIVARGIELNHSWTLCSHWSSLSLLLNPNARNYVSNLIVFVCRVGICAILNWDIYILWAFIDGFLLLIGGSFDSTTMNVRRLVNQNGQLNLECIADDYLINENYKKHNLPGSFHKLVEVARNVYAVRLEHRDHQYFGTCTLAGKTFTSVWHLL